MNSISRRATHKKTWGRVSVLLTTPTRANRNMTNFDIYHQVANPCSSHIVLHRLWRSWKQIGQGMPREEGLKAIINNINNRSFLRAGEHQIPITKETCFYIDILAILWLGCLRVDLKHLISRFCLWKCLVWLKFYHLLLLNNYSTQKFKLLDKKI